MTSNLVIETLSAGGITTIRLNRPDQLNSLDVETKTHLLTDLQAAGADPEVRAVVITGTGAGFCAGQDLGETHAAPGGVHLGDLVRQQYNPIMRTVATMPKPVLAAINGTTAGAGLSLALACDIRIATESAKFTTAFAGIGLSCDTGISWTLPRIIGRAASLDLLLRPRVIDSAEALRLGLVHTVVNDESFTEAVGKAAAELAVGPTLALASIKAAVNLSSTAPLDGALEFEASLMTLTGESRDHRTAVEAFLDKRKPVFEGF
ncbi:enoyl-CoA hydratase-related protein [Rhodococcus wratislaviensis]|uniref:enoyl-CoA hydratase-related protein n=1 Tax=Rhodococcus wratislaviensis TaxID=44752 RepID=UPI0035182292